MAAWGDAHHIGRKVIWCPGEVQDHLSGQVYREMAIERESLLSEKRKRQT